MLFHSCTVTLILLPCTVALLSAVPYIFSKYHSETSSGILCPSIIAIIKSDSLSVSCPFATLYFNPLTVFSASKSIMFQQNYVVLFPKILCHHLNLMELYLLRELLLIFCTRSPAHPSYPKTHTFPIR